MTTKASVPILIATLLAVALGYAPARVAFGATWTVTSYGDDAGDATTLRGALHAARDGDTIDLTGLTGPIYLRSRGAQILTELPVAYSISIHGPGPDKLAIDGGGLSTVFRVYTGANVTISGLTIRNGNATQVLDTAGNTLGLGGGIANSGTLALSNCAIVGNVAYGGGGGIMNEPGKTLTISNCTVSGNYAKPTGSPYVPASGGAIWNSPARLVDPASFTPGTVTIADTTIDYNNFEGPGAPAIVNEGSLSITGGDVSFNEGFESPAVVSDGGTLALTNVTLQANDGGAIGNGGSATVTGSTFAGNTNAAIRNGGTLRLTNSTIVASEPVCTLGFGCDDSGHAIVNSGLTVVINSTIAQNVGFGLTADAGVEYFLKNTIVAHNSRGNCDAQGQTIESEGHNLSDDATCAAYLSNDNDFSAGVDAGLDPSGLKDNGGPTQTIALTPSSVAIDAIPLAACDVATDQRGIPRPQGRGCDVGAYEASVTTLSIARDEGYFVSIGAITQDVGTSLRKKLDAAAGYRAAGDCADAGATYQALINELKAQSGKKVDVQAAAILITDARYLIAHCP